MTSTRPDVIVVGLGSMGAAAAYELAARGARVVGLDRFTPPHSRGAHAGGSRIIRMAYAEGADYVPLLRRAYQRWHELELDAGTPLVTTTGGLMLGRERCATVAGALTSARTHGLAHELLDAAEVRRRFPAFAPADDEVGLYEEVAGVLRPEDTVEHLLDLAARAGAELRYGSPVRGWRAGPDGVNVTTDEAELSAGRLVICPGGWAPGLLADLRLPLRVERRVQHYWSPPGPEFDPGTCPIWIWETAPGMRAYGVPTGPGGPAGTPATKAAFHDVGGPADAEAGTAPVREDEHRSVVEWLTGRLPTLARADWLGGTPCLYTLTPDEHFVLGPHPDHETVVVAAGFSGHGFKFVPVVGEILADLTLTGRTSHPIGLFDPGRLR